MGCRDILHELLAMGWSTRARGGGSTVRWGRSMVPVGGQVPLGMVAT